MNKNSANFIYEGYDTKFYYTFDDLSIVDKYDKAEKELNVVLNEQTDNVNMKERIVVSSNAILMYLNTILSEKIVTEMLGKDKKVSEILKVKNSLLQYVGFRMTEENSAIQKSK